MTPIYFDHAATTPVHPDVLAAMLPYFSVQFGNPSELHELGRAAHHALERARQQVAAALGADDSEIIFTAGGTEADNLALTGYLQRFAPAHLIVSAVEHPAVLQTARALAQAGWELDEVPVDGEGVVDLEAYRRAFRPTTRLVSIMAANNVFGTLQPIGQMAEIAHERGAAFHTDAVQMVGALPVDVNALGVDMLSLSGHKFHGPKGVGALYVRRGLRLGPLLHGGGQERRLRSGTENVPGIVGLGAAIDQAVARIGETAPRLRLLRDRLVTEVLAAVPQVRYLGHPTERLPGNAAFALHAVEGESLLLLLDAQGFMVSSGSACASGSGGPSPVIRALGVSAEEAQGSLRITLGRENTDDEVDAFLAVFPRIVGRLREMSPLYAGEH